MTTNSVPNWQLKGVWFDACKCEIPCPCSFAHPPTYGDCSGILLWHVREGAYGSTRLDDLNVAMLGSFVGNVWSGEHTDAYAAVFLDERADDDQRAGLQAIFGGEAGGWPAQFGAMFGPEILGMATEGERVQVHNLPGSEVGPGQGPATWGKATTDHADAFGFLWDRSGRSSKIIPFEWSGPDTP